MRKRTSDACARVNRCLKPPIWRLPFLLMPTPVCSSRRSLRRSPNIVIVLTVIVAIFISIGAPGVNCIAQDTQHPDAPSQLTELLNGVPDVTIFVIPTSGDTARVALAYSSRVPHTKVRQEIQKLRSNGWGIGNDISVTDGSMGPNGRVTTSGHFSLFKAPQIVNSAPELLPYLQAFQDRGHVTVVFQQSELRPYNGIDNFETHALVVRRMPADNAYQYEALIQDHKGKLPPLVPAASTHSAAPQNTGAAQASAAGGMPLLPLMLILSGIGIVGGLCVYNWIARRVDRAVPTRRAP